jgi:hypothetical protein
VPAAAFASTASNLRGMGTEHWSLPGAEFARDASRSPGLSGAGYTLLRVSLWLPAILLVGLWFLTAAASRRLRTRTREGLCARCGYDLRATPGQCPECGMATASAPSVM